MRQHIIFNPYPFVQTFAVENIGNDEGKICLGNGFLPVSQLNDACSHLFKIRFRKLDHELQQVVLDIRSEEHTSELQSIMRRSYAVFCLKTKTDGIKSNQTTY